MQKEINWIVENWDKIPDTFKSNLHPGRYSKNIPGLCIEDHIVVLLIDRQKPSVEACYSFDEERISVNRKGQIIWGFDSGCSCPSPWIDSYPDCYKHSKEWKEFFVNIGSFDPDIQDELKNKIEEIKQSVKSE